MSENPYQPPEQESFAPVIDTSKGQAPEKISVGAHLMCGWPLALVAIGGLIGGVCGGIAYAINLAVYKTAMPMPVKIILNIVVGVGAIVVWLIAAIALTAAIQG